MISHLYKCIFIHIPRCAGTSIETWLCGRDWWEVDPSTKHLTASQARIAYREFWDGYFKFAVVRDPYSRTISMLKHADHFGLYFDADHGLNYSVYEYRYGRDVVIEHDHRFNAKQQIMHARHLPGQVYGNILDETLDFIARFEHLAADMAFIQHKIGVPNAFEFHVEQSSTARPVSLSARDRAWIAKTYAEDFSSFGYPR